MKSLRGRVFTIRRQQSASREFRYRKILIISPGLIFSQRPLLAGLFRGKLTFGGAYY